jgi:hypothetical protein
VALAQLVLPVVSVLRVAAESLSAALLDLADQTSDSAWSMQK